MTRFRIREKIFIFSVLVVVAIAGSIAMCKPPGYRDTDC